MEAIFRNVFFTLFISLINLSLLTLNILKVIKLKQTGPPTDEYTKNVNIASYSISLILSCVLFIKLNTELFLNKIWLSQNKLSIVMNVFNYIFFIGSITMISLSLQYSK
jgi:hypothetical protein